MRFQVRANHMSREGRDDGVAEGAQLSIARGKPISQQANCGFNPPSFSVVPDDVGCAAPRPVRIEIAASDLLCCELPASRYLCSEAVGVGFNVAAICVMSVYLPCGWSRIASFIALGRKPTFEFPEAVNVAHTAAVTCRGN